MTGYWLDIPHMSDLNVWWVWSKVEGRFEEQITVMPLGLAWNAHDRFAEWTSGLRFTCILVQLQKSRTLPVRTIIPWTTIQKFPMMLLVFQQKIYWVRVSQLPTQSAILSLVKILSAMSSCTPSIHRSDGHSGHRIGNTIRSSGAAPAPSGSNLLMMYWERQPTQYVCWFGQGSRRPKGRRVDELAESEAERGEWVFWKVSPHIPQVGLTWTNPSPL